MKRYHFFIVIYPIKMTERRNRALCEFAATYYKTQSTIVKNRQT